MKITPIATSGAGNTTIAEEGRSAGAERVARAKAILSGGTASINPAAPDRGPAPDAQAERAIQSIKKIKMRTNATPTSTVDESLLQPPVENVAGTDKGNTTDKVESTEPVTEATKPLSPQFAALVKQQRALQVKEREIAAREQALATKEAGTTSDPELLARLKSDPLSVLDEQGVTYDQLTEAILARSQEQGPAYQRLQAEIKALKEGLENQNKSQVDRDQAARTQVVAQMRKDADHLVANSGDTFELVREAGYTPKAIELIERTFDKTGEIMDVEEALTEIESDLVKEALKYQKTKKIQTQLSATAPQQAAGSQPKPIRTLTNRDGASAQMSRRDRALAAFSGKLQ